MSGVLTNFSWLKSSKYKVVTTDVLITLPKNIIIIMTGLVELCIQLSKYQTINIFRKKF